jgi:hypothetical protein
VVKHNHAAHNARGARAPGGVGGGGLVVVWPAPIASGQHYHQLAADLVATLPRDCHPLPAEQRRRAGRRRIHLGAARSS